MKPPCLSITTGTLNALKWLALVFMVGDHVNKYLLGDTIPYLFAAGRIVLPLFLFVLAYNLARPDTLQNGVYLRVMQRLLFFGALASMPFVALGGLLAGWWPLNILFTLLALAATVYFVDSGHFVIAGIVFLIGGSSVEFWWPAIIFGVAVWAYCKQPSWSAAIVAILACSALWVINRNMWAMVALPLILATPSIEVKFPRCRYGFYIFYPAHLAIILLLKKTLFLV